MESATVREAITRNNRKFMDAAQQKNVAAISQLYTSDAQVLPPQTDAVIGKPAIEQFWGAVMGMGITGVTLETADLQEAGDTAYEVGRYSLVSGNQTVDSGKYVVVWRHENGEWKLHRDIWNSSIAPK